MIARRNFLRTAGLATLAPQVKAAVSPGPMKITRIRYYHNPRGRPLFNQSYNIVTIETDAGITGIGEGGSKDTVEQCAAMIIGEDPSRIEYLWQMMYRGYFYPAGREKLDALGAIDLALWDIKGKALGVPVYELLGGFNRKHMECYATSFPNKGSLKESARACIEAGFRAYRSSVVDPSAGQAFNSHQIVRRTFEACQQIREGVGKEGDWALDYHTRLDLPDAIRLSTLIEPLEPYFAEDLIRSENPGVYRELRKQVKVPIAVGEQFGAKWDVNELIENQLIDYSRMTLPNVGGITEFMKIAAMCDTHYVGLIPHFTGPLSEAALVHACGATSLPNVGGITEFMKIAAMCDTHYVGLIPHFTGPLSEAALVHACGATSLPCMMEITGDGPKPEPHLPVCMDWNKGKIMPNRRPGLGVELDTKPLELQATITERYRVTPIWERPDGSITNW